MGSRVTLQHHAPSDRYYARIQVGNIRRRFWFGANKKTAQCELVGLLKRVGSGEIVFVEEQTTARVDTDGRRDMLLKELAVRHLDWMQEHRSPGTYQARRNYLRRFLDYMGPCMVSSIDLIKLESFYAHARKRYGHSANGGNEHLAHVKAMFLWAEEREICDRPVRRFPKIHRAPAPTKRVGVDDLRLIIAELPPDLRDLVLFGLYTGLRPQEIRALTTDDIQEGADNALVVVIERHKTSTTAKDPKPRSIPLSDEAAAIVRRQIACHPKAMHVFLNDAGTPYTKDTLRRRLRRHSLRLGIKTVTPYSLRHTFASMQSEAGANQMSLAQLMGHTTVRTTSRYVHNSDAYYRSAMDNQAQQLQAVLGDTGGKDGDKKVAT